MKEVEFRPASLNEREEFYKKEFKIRGVKSWFKINDMNVPQLCAIDAGTDTKTIKNKKWKGIMFYFPFNELMNKIKKYTPEDVYYDRNVYQNPKRALQNLNNKKWKEQELVFDIDSDNIICDHKKGKTYDECIKKAYRFALELDKELKKYFDKTEMVYSGRGFHIHVLDKKAFQMSKEEREKFVSKFKKYPIDQWVSAGNIELVRLPFSLNSLVSRKVIPLYKNKFNKNKTIPKFMKTP